MKAAAQHNVPGFRTRFQNAMRSATGKGMVKTDEHCCSGIHTRPFICGALTNCLTGGRFPHMYSAIRRDFAAPV